MSPDLLANQSSSLSYADSQSLTAHINRCVAFPLFAQSTNQSIIKRQLRDDALDLVDGVLEKGPDPVCELLLVALEEEGVVQSKNCKIF